MRLTIGIVLCLFSLTTMAASDVKCYSDGLRIYHGKVDDFSYDGILFVFNEHKSHDTVFVAGECVIKMKS